MDIIAWYAKARCQSNAFCIPHVAIDVLVGKNNRNCLVTVEILVVASENDKIIFKWLKFPPMLRPRKSPLAAVAYNSIFVAHPSAVYAELEMFILLKSEQWIIIKHSQQCKKTLFLTQWHLLESDVFFFVRLTHFVTMLIPRLKYGTAISVSIISFVIYPCKQIRYYIWSLFLMKQLVTQFSHNSLMNIIMKNHVVIEKWLDKSTKGRICKSWQTGL